MLSNDTRIQEWKPLISPTSLIHELPLTKETARHIQISRIITQSILHNKDPRLLVVVGPCSIHDPLAALEYAQKLKLCSDRWKKELHIVMRVYFAKPRTALGWKGLIYEPSLNGQFDINKGLYLARKLLLEINQIQVPTATEFLDTVIPQYLADLTSWSAIGARTSESPLHRELASGLSMPLGFKNNLYGCIQSAIDGVLTAKQAHHFLGVSQEGSVSIVCTKGNPDCHVVLRGSVNASNYDASTIQGVASKLKNLNLPSRIMIDTSHGNSKKNYKKQLDVINSVSSSIIPGGPILGVMIESNLVGGRQSHVSCGTLTYGQSITDACLSWESTEQALEYLAQIVKKGGVRLST